MEIIRMAAGVYAANCYIVYSKETMEGVIVDPGGDVDDILKLVGEKDIKIVGIVLTHGHADHIGGVPELKEKLGVDVMIHEADAEMLADAGINLSSQMPMNTVAVKADRILQDGDIIKIGHGEMLVIHTPGHTRGGISLKVEDNILTGDTLFQGSIGRTDLHGGDLNTILKSIKEKIFAYDRETNIYPGHGAPTNIATEERFNPFVKKR